MRARIAGRRTLVIARAVRAFSAFSTLAAVTALGACGLFGRGAPPPAPLRPPARDTLLAADVARGEQATRQGFATAAEGWLDTAAIYLRAGAPVLYGLDAVRPILGAGMPAGATYRFEPLGGGLARDARTGYTYGAAIVVTPDTAAGAAGGAGGFAPVVRVGHYLAFWRRTAGGPWRIAAYADVGGPPVPADVQLPSAPFAPALNLPRGPRADAVHRVREADSAFALMADLQGTGVAFSTYIAPHGAVFAGTEVVTGSDGVRALFERMQQAGSTLNWRPVYADAAESGDLGMTVGEAVTVARQPTTGTVFQRFSKYLTIWQRQANGDWRFVVDGGNPSPTPVR